MYNKGKQLKTFFVYMGQNAKNKIIFWLPVFEGPWETFNDQTGPILLSRYPLTHIYVHVK